MRLTTEREKEIVEYGSRKNLLIESNAVELLKTLENFKEVLDELLTEEGFIITREQVEKKILKPKMAAFEEQKTEVFLQKGFKPFAKSHEARIRLLEETDITGKSNSEGKAKDFLDFFQNRFKQLQDILRKRQGLFPKPIKRVASAGKNEEIDIIGMVFKKWLTKNGNLALQLEDLEEKCIVLLQKGNISAAREAEKIMPDDVIAVRGTKLSDELVIAKEIVLPDIPNRKQAVIEAPVSIAGLTDIHVGNKLFLEKEFNDFLEWINGKCEEKDKEVVGGIKYIVITGDNVDGIGIYPGQEKELRIKDIYQQYEEFCRLVSQIPEYIEIIIAPGNHDAVRRADPQPALPERLVKELKPFKNIHFVGSPSMAEIEGLKVLLYHGASIHDLISSTSHLSNSEPEKAMIEMMRKRSLMSSFGLNNPYVPEKKDYLVIGEIPDYIFFGEMHHNGYANYRGTMIINSGTWQARTAYQARLGNVPTPGIVPIAELDTGKIREKRFYSGETS